jgi:hypothetical protein
VNSSAYTLQVLVYDATLNYNRWASLSFTVAPDDSVSGTFEYTNPVTELTGRRIPGPDGSQQSYELDGAGVSLRFSMYPAFGAQCPVAGVGSINESMPYFFIGKRAS